MFGWRNWVGKHSEEIWNFVHGSEIVRSKAQLESLLIRTLFDWYCVRGHTNSTSPDNHFTFVHNSFEIILGDAVFIIMSKK